MSFAGSDGSGMSADPFDVDVDEALREFGAPGDCAPDRAISNADDRPGDANASGQPPASDHAEEQEQDREQAGGEVPSIESSGSDVIHIDLTQRPPSLPMSGLALEELMSMLPGSTYAVSGSGVRIRSAPLSEPARTSPRVSPRSDARQQSPSAKASPKGQRADTAATGPGGNVPDGNEAPDAESAVEPAADESDSEDADSGEGASRSGHGSPRVALTFIPGIGLCPVVIHDVLEDEEDEENEDYLLAMDLDACGVEAPGLVAAADDDDDDDDDGGDDCPRGGSESADEAVAAAGGGADEPCSSSDGVEPSHCQPTEAYPGPPAEVRGSDTAQADPCEAVTAATAAERSGAAPGAAASSKQLDISEEQLKSIIQQAMHGLDFRDMAPEQVQEEAVADDSAEDEDSEHEDGEQEQSEDASYGASDAGADSPERQALYERLFGGTAAAGRPSSVDPKASTGRQTGAAEATDPAVRRLLGVFEAGPRAAEEAQQQPREQPAAAEAAAAPAPPVEAGVLGGSAPAPAHANESSEEYEDDLVVDEGTDSLDEVDDSGSGGGDEPESMLGGLGAHGPRMALATDPVQLGLGGKHQASAAAAGRQFTATTVDADGIHPQLEIPAVSGLNSSVRGSTVAAGIAADDAHAAAPQVAALGGGAGGLHLPRPRYLSHTVGRSYEGAAAHGASDEDAVPLSSLGPQGEIEKVGVQVRPARVSDGSASGAAATSSDDGSFSSSSRAATGSTTAGSSGSSGGGGSATDLNSTLRSRGQSLAAIRLAALQAEGQRMARSMAERLGGGGDKAPAAKPEPGGHQHTPNNSHPAGPRPASSITNPFGCAEHEASAAAGLVDMGLAARSGSSSSGRHHSGAGRRGASGSSTGYLHSEGRHRRQHGDGAGEVEDGEAAAEGVVDQDVDDDDDDEGGDLEDMLRDRTIIQPRYPTDAKKSRHQHHHHNHHQVNEDLGTSDLAPDSLEDDDHVDLSRTMESDGRGSWRPRHRRSFDVVDLDALSEGQGHKEGGEDAQPQRLGTVRSKSADGSSPPSPPSSRSLLATRKSDDGQFPAPPLPSSSPRMQHDSRDDDSGSDTDSGASSSARSVGDERLADELEALREELGQKTTLVAGLRGELRKYTDLVMRLEHQLAELRSHNGEAAGASTAAPAARTRTQSDTGGVGGADALLLSPGQPNGSVPRLQIPGGNGGAGTISPAARPAHDGPPPPPSPAASGGSHDGAAHAAGVQPHTLPPHPQAQGLEAPARLAVYQDIVRQVQAQVDRSGGPAPPDLREAHELCKGEEVLDAGTEKVLLIKLQKIMVWGCEAAWKAAMAQQQTRYMEHAAQQAAQARSAWEAERQELVQALEDASAAAAAAAGGGGLPWFGRSAGGSRSLDGGGAGGPEADLRRQLQEAHDETAIVREQAADLESAVASLNADVRRLRGQLRNSYDGGGGADRNSGDGNSDTAAEHAARADSKAWAMERKLLLTTITGLQGELQQVRAASEAATAADRSPAAGASPVRSDEAAKKFALAEAAMDRVLELQAERDSAVAESTELRRKLEEALAATVAAAQVAETSETGSPESGEGEPSLRREVEQLRQQLAAARDALERRTADAEAAVALHEAQSAALRAQVVDLRRELAMNAAELGARAALREAEDRRVQQEDEAREAAVRSDALARELRQQLAASEEAREQIKAALRAAQDERSLLEDKLRKAREALAAAVLAGEEAAAEAMARRSLPALDPPVPPEREVPEPPQDPGEVLRVKTRECERLQRLVEGRTRELAAAESQLEDVRSAVSELQAEASETQAQVAELQAVLLSMQSVRETAEAQLADAQAAAAAAEERASDAHATALLAEAALARALEEAEALRGRVSGLEDELERVREEAGAWRGKAEEAEGALAEAHAEAAGLQAEARDLRTALSAEDTVQAQLIGQVECLERELETQASLAQKRSQQADRMKAALAQAEADHHRHDNAAAAAVDRAATAAAEELRRARAATAAAQQRAAELEAHVVELQLQLVEERSGSVEAANGTRRRHADVAGERALTEPQVPDLVAQIGAVQHAVAASSSPPPLSSESVVDERQRMGKEEGAELAKVEDRTDQRQGQGQGDQRHHTDMEDAAAGGPNHSPEAAASAAMLEERLHVAELESAALRAEVSDLRRQQDSAADPAAVAAAEEQLASLRSERAQLLAECTALTAELQAARAEAVVRRGEQTQVEALRHQLQIARSELQAARADLQSASVELSVKGELMAAKDRSLATLQETVDALKLALQVTQQNLQPVVQSPRRAAAESGEEIAPGEDDVDRNLQKYRGTVAALQNKFADSESTIRRLEKQVAALETKLSSDESPAPTPVSGSGQSPDGKSQQLPPASSSRQQLQQPLDAASLELRLKEKEAENGHLLQELLLLRRAAAATPSEPGALPPGGMSGVSPSDGSAVEGATGVPSLHMQLQQWRNVGEDLHARYQSKKETVRRLREQLAAEQQRRANEQAQNQAQLQAASQRLGRLAAELGTALRRCIALDLQPLSATTLTTSPRAPLGNGALPDDINALASLLARQGAALVESLEAALDQVNIAREERALVTAQLANRQAVLDELRHHLARQAVSAPGQAEAASVSSAAPAGPGTARVAGRFSPALVASASRVSPTPAGVTSASVRASDVQAASSTAAGATGGGSAPTPQSAGGGPHGLAGSAAAAGVAAPPPGGSADMSMSMSAAAATGGSPATQALHAAALSLAQDMAALSAQQAGVRSALQSFEQRPAQPSARPRSLSATTYPFTAGSSGAYPGQLPIHTAVSYPAISPLRGSRTSGAAVDAFAALTAAVPSGSPSPPPHSYVGILSGSRVEPRTPLGAVSTGGGLHTITSLRQGVYGMYGQAGTAGLTTGATSTVDALRALDAAGATSPLLSPTRLQFYANGGGSAVSSASGGGGSLTSPGALGLSSSTSATGVPAVSSGLGLSRERRLKLADAGL